MKIKNETAMRMMDIVAYTLCRTVCQGEAFQTMSNEELAEYVNNTTREIFVAFCDEVGIEEVEEE